MTQSTKSLRVKPVFIDLRKGFDSLYHSQLVDKLYNYGFTKLHQTNRWQYVFDNARVPEKLPVVTAVPRDSILRPFFFLVYVNDLPAVYSTKCKIAIFADNTSLFQSGKKLI